MVISSTLLYDMLIPPLLLAALIFMRHKDNIQRLKKGQEHVISRTS